MRVMFEESVRVMVEESFKDGSRVRIRVRVRVMVTLRIGSRIRLGLRLDLEFWVKINAI